MLILHNNKKLNSFGVVVAQADGIVTTERLHDVLAGERISIANSNNINTAGTVGRLEANPTVNSFGASNKYPRLQTFKNSLWSVLLMAGVVQDEHGKSHLTFPNSWNTIPPEVTVIDMLRDLLFRVAYFPEVPMFVLAVLALICTPVLIVYGSRRPKAARTLVLIDTLISISTFNRIVLFAYTAILLVVFTFVLDVYFSGHYSDLPRVYAWYHHLRVDNFVFHMKVIILLLSLGTLLTVNVFERGRQRTNQWKFLLILLTVPNLLLIISSNNLLTAFVFIEIISIISYALVAITRTAEPDRVAQTALTYFAQGSVASAVLLLGIVGCVYGTGQWDFDYLSAMLGSGVQVDVFQRISVFLILFGLLFKVGVIPGHLWVQRVYADVSDPVLLFFTTAVKFSFLVLFFRAYLALLPVVQDHYSLLVLLIACTSLTVGLTGGLSAIEAQNWRDFIAFTSINQVGYVLAGLTFFDSNELMGAAMYYLFTYILSNFVFVASLAHLQKVLYPQDARYAQTTSEEPRKLSEEEKQDLWWVVAATNLSAWSIAGLPPLAGFFGKAVLIKKLGEVAMQSHSYASSPDLVPAFWDGRVTNFPDVAWMAASTLFLLIVVSIASFYYYFKVFEWVHSSLRSGGAWWSSYSPSDRSKDIELVDNKGLDTSDSTALFLFEQHQRRVPWVVGVATMMMVLWFFIIVGQGDLLSVPTFFKLPYPLAP